MTSIEFQKAIEPALNELILAEGCGFLDGGCYTLASAIKTAFPDSCELMCISRNTMTLDHVVTYFPRKNLYLDGDGWQTKDELFYKMNHVEDCPAKVLFPINNCDIEHSIFKPIKQQTISILKELQPSFNLSS